MVLIVDDEPDFREIFSAKLKNLGYRVDVAENGEVALMRMIKERPDLVLMDVRMPVMDGATAVLRMKEDPKLKNVKVAFLTSLGDPQPEMQQMSKRFSSELGVQDYLKKTEDLDTLGEKIRALLP